MPWSEIGLALYCVAAFCWAAFILYCLIVVRPQIDPDDDPFDEDDVHY